MPGVPPDAMNTLKRAFKGLFKRGKKSKTDSQQPDGTTSAPPPPSYPQPPPKSAGGSQAAAPQLPPIQSNSPLSSATESSKPLPPTHPLSTGQHDRPQEAVPQNYDARPGPPAPVAAPAGAPPSTLSTGVDGTKDDQLSTGAVSPPDHLSTADGRPSADVSAMEESSQTEEAVKTDSAVEPMKTETEEPPVATEAQPVATEVQPAATKENVKPIGTDTITTSTAEQPTKDLPPTPPTEEEQPLQHTVSSEEKVAVTMEEPPPIKTGRTAPGMSATSGPLEEFPEGGYTRE